MSSICATHIGRPASHRCDGCRRFLCPDCVKQSHRLLLCAHCGEMALPVSGGGPRTSTELRRTVARSATYTFADAFLYPFRGKGGGVFWSYFVLLAIFEVVPLVIPFSGLVLWLPSIVVGLMVPRLLFTIVRTTAEGDDELPDWPEFDFWARLVDFFAMLLIGFIAIVPGVVIFLATGCDVLTLMGQGEGLSCWPPLVVSFFVGVAIWIPALGATAVFDSLWLLPRLDLHLRALLVSPAQALLTTVVLAPLLLASWVLRFAFLAVPWIGILLSVFVAIYGVFTGAHLVGLYFRRHFGEMERLYL